MRIAQDDKMPQTFFGLDIIYPKVRSEIVDQFKSFPDDVLFFIWSDEGYNYFWLKHNGKALPVTVRYDWKKQYYMTMDEKSLMC